jgi:hypothetical protein
MNSPHFLANGLAIIMAAHPDKISIELLSLLSKTDRGNRSKWKSCGELWCFFHRQSHDGKVLEPR